MNEHVRETGVDIVPFYLVFLSLSLSNDLFAIWFNVCTNVKLTLLFSFKIQILYDEGASGRVNIVTIQSKEN